MEGRWDPSSRTSEWQCMHFPYSMLQSCSTTISLSDLFAPPCPPRFHPKVSMWPTSPGCLTLSRKSRLRGWSRTPVMNTPRQPLKVGGCYSGLHTNKIRRNCRGRKMTSRTSRWWQDLLRLLSWYTVFIFFYASTPVLRFFVPVSPI